MARLDVHARRDGEPGWLLDVQADLLSALTSRIVIPLVPVDRGAVAARKLNPIFEIAGERAVLATQFVAAIPLRELGPRVASLDDAHDTITAALDLALTGV